MATEQGLSQQAEKQITAEQVKEQPAPEQVSNAKLSKEARAVLEMKNKVPSRATLEAIAALPLAA